jgi:hypothetical protein
MRLEGWEPENEAVSTRVVKALAIACIALAALACSQRGEHGTPAASHRVSEGPPRLVAPSELTEQERRFGVSPTRNAQVTYQPGVIIVENGSQLIRKAGGDGMTWIVDAAAVEQHGIQPGKVVFLTSRAVGRVLAVQRDGDASTLTLGPVELADVIRDCDIQMEAPIDFSQSLVYRLDQMPGAVKEVAPIAWQPAPSTLYADWRDTSPEFQLVADTRGGGGVTDAIAALGNIGAQIHAEKNGTGMNGEVLMSLQQPRIGFKLVMSGATVKVAELRVYGGTGVSIGFEAVNRNGSRHNINEHIQVPADISIPIGGPLPLTVTVRQQFIVQTAFGAPGALKARADYTYDGVLGVAYHDPYFAFEGPGGFGGRESLLNSAQGISLAPGALSLTHQVKVIGGFGAFNFVVGPYAFLNTNANVAHHGATDTLARCIFAGFNMRVGTGVGYVIPQPVTDAINFFLGALNLKPISGEGGKTGPSSFLLKNVDIWPQSAVCTKDSNSTRKPPAPVA